jgi:hypothetical protein
MGSPCIDVCRFDEETGWCFGCGMLRKDKKAWKKDKPSRPAILGTLPPRLAALREAGHATGKAAKRKKGDKRKGD